MNENILNLLFDYLYNNGYPQIESVTSFATDGKQIRVNINTVNFGRKEGITIEMLELLAFTYQTK